MDSIGEGTRSAGEGTFERSLIYVEPEHWIMLKKQGYQTERISPELRRSFAYWANSLGIGGMMMLLLMQRFGIGAAGAAGISIAIGIGGAIIDLTNPSLSNVVSGIPTPIQRKLVDAELAKQGER